MNSPATTPKFSVAEARALVSDLFQPSAAIYWTDFLVSLTIGYGAAAVYFLAPLFSWQQLVCMFVAAFALHRVANFMHEIAHLRSKGYLSGFCMTWDILAGVPMLIPSYFFDSHLAHHNGHHFGTDHDCEYVPLGRGPVWGIAKFLSQVFLQPLYVVTRFAILGPLSFLHPKLRSWVLRRASAFVFVFSCERSLPNRRKRIYWALIDTLCTFRAWAIFVTALVGLNPWYRMPQLYVLAIFTLGLHYIRSLAAHRYLGDGQPMTFQDQLMDSIDITGDRVLTELMFPVGLRYHALHHLFPSMPYHNLPEAHRRLMANLPSDSPYRSLVYPNFRAVLRELFQHSLAAQRQQARIPPRAAA